MKVQLKCEEMYSSKLTNTQVFSYTFAKEKRGNLNGLKSDSHLPKKCFICITDSPFWILKALRSQNIHYFVETFWSYRRYGLI